VGGSEHRILPRTPSNLSRIPEKIWRGGDTGLGSVSMLDSGVNLLLILVWVGYETSGLCDFSGRVDFTPAIPWSAPIAQRCAGCREAHGCA